MPDTMRKEVQYHLRNELEALEEGEPIEEPDSDYRLIVFLVSDGLEGLQASSQRVGPDGVHDVEGIVAMVDVSLSSNHFLVTECLQLFFDETIPTNESGMVDPDWPIDPSILSDAHELAWERHCMVSIDDWVDDVLTQIETRRANLHLE